MRVIELITDLSGDGIRAETFLKRKGFSSQDIAVFKHTEGSFSRNGKPARLIDPVRAGDCIRISIEADGENIRRIREETCGRFRKILPD